MPRVGVQRTLVDVWQHTTLCDGDVAQQLVQLLVVSDRELEMSRDDSGLLVVPSGVSGQLEDFGREVLKDGSQVDGGTCDALGTVGIRTRRDIVPAPTR